MLNPVLRNSMIPEHRVLYDLKIHLQDEVIKERIANSVKHIRKVNRRRGSNELEIKLDKFGNNGGYYFERARKAIKNLYYVKPISKNFVGLWRSIEFELIFKSKDAREEFSHAVRGIGISEFVTIQEDKSIKLNEKDFTGITNEVVITYRAGDEDSVYKFCKCLKGRAYVNWSCGTHFHFDMRQMTDEQVTEYGNRIARAVPALRLLLPKDRRESKFQKAVINTTTTPCVYPHKYAFVNLAAFNKHRTMEIRAHSGTLRADKILNWIKLIEKIMLTTVDAHTIFTIDALIETYKLDNELAAYVRKRAEMFEDVRDSHSWTGYVPRHSTEEEEIPANQIEIPVHPAFLTPIPVAKNAQAAPKHPILAVGLFGAQQ